MEIGRRPNFHSGNGHQTQTFSIILLKLSSLLTHLMPNRITKTYMVDEHSTLERLVFPAIDALRLISLRGGYFNRTSTQMNYDDHYIDYTAGLRGMEYIGVGKTLELSYSYDQYDSNDM